MSKSVHPGANNRNQGGALAVLGLATMLSSLGTSIANVGLPAIAHSFEAPLARVQWVVLAYLLAITSLIVGAGRLGDLAGRRRLLQGGAALFTLASVVCGAAPTLAVLVAARAAQGLGAALMMALSLGMVGSVVPKERTGSAIGLLATMSAAGTALGPALGGTLISTLGWQAIFLVLAPLGVLTLWYVRRLPADPPPSEAVQGAFDAPGTLLLALTLSAYALAVTTGRGSFGAVNAALLAAAGGGLAAFLVVQTRAAAPLVPLALLRDTTLLAALATTALVMTVMMATLVVGPFYLSGGLGLGAGMVGALMSVGPVVTAITGRSAGRLVDRFGEPGMVGLGLAAVAAGCLALAGLPRALGPAGYAGSVSALTAGYALFQAATSTAVLKHAQAADRGVLSGLLSLFRNLGLVSGASMMGAVFARGAGTEQVAAASPGAVEAGLHSTFAVALLLIGLAAAIAAGSRALASRRLAADAIQPAQH